MRLEPQHGIQERAYIANPEETTYESLNNLLMMMIELILLESVGALRMILSADTLRQPPRLLLTPIGNPSWVAATIEAQP